MYVLSQQQSLESFSPQLMYSFFLRRSLTEILISNFATSILFTITVTAIPIASQWLI